MKKLFSLVMVLVLVASLCACGGAQNPSGSSVPSSGGGSGSDLPAEGLPLSGIRIAYVLNVVSTDIFQLATKAAQETAQALGATCDVYFTDTDNVRFQDTVSTCANQGYDAMFLSHGNQETSYDLVTGLVEKGIRVVCFDTQFVDAAGENASIDGVTQMFQDDQGMAAMLLDYVLEMYPEKVEAGEPVRILKIWRGPGISPFDRRQEAYLEYEEQGLIETLEVLAPADPKNGESSMTDVMAATLPKYAEGSVDAIWSCYDAYARGAYVALSEAGRTDIPMVSVDISNQDINYMLNGDHIWRACATVDFTTIGQQGVRILAMMLKGEQTEAVYNLTPSIVTYDQLNPDSNVTNLSQAIEGYGVNDDHISDWMKPYLAG